MGTLLAFTTVAISVLVVRYAPPYEMPMDEMPMEVALAGTPETLTSCSGHSEQDEQNLEDPFGNGNEKIGFLLTVKSSYSRNSVCQF